MSSVKTFAGCIKKGLEADKPAWTAYLEDFIYYTTDTGNLYYYGPSSRTLIQGSEKSEILKNKSINFAENTVSGIIKDPFLSMKREGFMTPAASAASSVQGALKGLPSVGNYTLVRDGVEGYVSKFDISVNGNIGYISNATINFVTRRAYNPRLKFRVKPSDSTTQNMMLGFSTALPVSPNSWAVDNTYGGSIFAITSAFTDYIIRTGNGGGVAATHYATGIAKVTAYKTFEIIMGQTDIKYYMDDVLVRTETTNLPNLTTDLYLTLQLQRSAALLKEFFIAKIYFKDDIAP